MAIQFDHVRPGDLITADLMNRVLDAIEGIDGRLSTVEQGGPPSALPIIQSVSSMTPRIGDTLTLSGSNFGIPAQRTVTIDGTLVSSTGNDTTISFTVPNLDNVTSSGKPVDIIVNNTAGPSKPTQVMVFPFVPTKPTGEVWVTLKQSPAETLSAGDHTFVYTVLAQVSLDETYNIQTSLDQTGWTAVVVDGSNNPISNPTVTLPQADPPGSSTDVRVKVTIPSGGAGSAMLTVRAVSQRNSALVGVNGSGDTITRDASAPPPPKGIQLTCFEYMSPSDASPANTTTTVTGPITITVTNNYWRLSFRGHFDKAGTYNAALGNLTDTHWTQTFTLASPSTTKAVAVGADASDVTIFVFVKATSGANPADITLSLVKSDDNTVQAQYAQRVQL